MKPILCKAGQQLRLQVDDSFPHRDRKSDGWIGDARHAATVSDHNPDAKGIVRAIDLDTDLSDAKETMSDLADQIRLCGLAGDKRLSYVIYDRRIASAKYKWIWRAYDGPSPHTEHCHVSFSTLGDEDSKFFQIPLLGGKHA
jgi:hypothetical protein